MVPKSLVILFLCSSLQLHGRFSPYEVAQETGECGKIVAGSIAAACIYGILNDQVTARVCPEYFTKGFHGDMVKRMPDGWIKRTLSTTDSPTQLGLIWGVIATWWMGAALSVPVVAAARANLNDAPKLTMKDLVKPTGYALIGMGVTSCVCGFIGYKRSADTDVRNYFRRHVAQDVPEESLSAFIADAYAHHMAYASGVVAAFGLTSWILYRRNKRKTLENSSF